MSRGNPWVQIVVPLPLPLKNPYPHKGKGFVKGHIFLTLTQPLPLPPTGFLHCHVDASQFVHDFDSEIMSNS
jgi:hypothetical protein